MGFHTLMAFLRRRFDEWTVADMAAFYKERRGEGIATVRMVFWEGLGEWAAAARMAFLRGGGRTDSQGRLPGAGLFVLSASPGNGASRSASPLPVIPLDEGEADPAGSSVWISGFPRECEASAESGVRGLSGTPPPCMSSRVWPGWEGRRQILPGQR